jgi:23S rRNA pseudouridine2605 synthase
VRVDGRVWRDPEKPVDVGANKIEVDGANIKRSANVYFMLNKPRGVVTTASDEKGRTTVYEFLGKERPWVAPVGRLDKASEGLLLLTNDSEWSARVLAPETHLDKIYHVRVDASVDTELLAQLQKGITTRDGNVLRVKRAHILRGGERRKWLEITLDEGKNRHIRRIFEYLGIEVMRLVRVAIGPLALGDLPKGSSRELTFAEKHSLDQAMMRSKRAADRVRHPVAVTW